MWLLPAVAPLARGHRISIRIRVGPGEPAGALVYSALILGGYRPVRCGPAMAAFHVKMRRHVLMLLVQARDGESGEAMISRFTKQVQRDGVLREFKRRR